MRVAGSVGMPGDHNQPAWLCLDADQRIDQDFGRIRLELGTAGSEQRQTVQSDRIGNSRGRRGRRWLNMRGQHCQQRRTQAFATVQAQAECQGHAVPVVGIQALGVLAKNSHSVFTPKELALLTLGRLWNGRIAP